MQIVINSYGSCIRKRGECFEFSVDKVKKEVSARKIQSLLITTAVLISTDAIQLAYENNIDVIFLDQYGSPFSRIWHSRFGSTNYIRRKQLVYSDGPEGLELAKSWIGEKLTHQMEFLEKLKRTREKKRERIEEYAEKLSVYRNQLEGVQGERIEEVRDRIFSTEAHAGKVYFDALNFIMPDQYKFSGRSRRPARDPFNAFLNYGYGVLYSRVERACILAGLDPFIGFLHTDNYGKRSFVFDVIEMFRIYIDQVVVSLFSRRMVKQSMYRSIRNGITLDKEGKQLLLEELNKAMEEKMRYRGRNIKLCNVMEFECHRLANSFIGRDKEVTLVTMEELMETEGERHADVGGV